MKDSGVAWLGEIPLDWKKTKVKFLGALILGLTYSPDDVVSDSGTLVLRSSNVQSGKVALDDCVYVSCDIPKKVVTKVNDILICSRNGSRSLIGKCALLTEEVSNQAFGAFMTVLRSKHARFLYYVLNSTLFKFQSGRFLTSTINQLTTQTLGDFEIALPLEDVEEERITNYLDTETQKIDAQCRQVEAVIERLQEYRAALITNAVTGKIDVRHWQLPNA
jgi:type I restriction enzyme S subunit